MFSITLHIQDLLFYYCSIYNTWSKIKLLNNNHCIGQKDVLFVRNYERNSKKWLTIFVVSWLLHLLETLLLFLLS